MSGLGTLLLVAALAATIPLSLSLLSWLGRPAAFRAPVESEIKLKARRLSAHDLEALKDGNYAILGRDQHTQQDVILPQAVRCQNVINLGPVGAGKTFYFLFSSLWRDLAYRLNTVIVFDSQYDLTEWVLALCRRFARTVVVFPAAGYNPLGEGGSARARAATFASLFEQAAEAGRGDGGIYYTREAALFILCIVPLFEAAYHQPMILQELLMACRRREYRERILTDAGLCPESANYRLYFETTPESELKKQLSGLENFIARLTIEERVDRYNQRTAPTLAQLIEEKAVIVIREGGSAGTVRRAAGLLWMVGLQEYVLHRDLAGAPGSTHPINVYCDEAYLYLNANFADTISQSRKHSVAFHLGFHSFEQLNAITRGHARIIANACRTWIVQVGYWRRTPESWPRTWANACFVCGP